MNKPLHFFFLYSNYIVTYGFYLYFFIYGVFKLYEKSILYNYLLILFLGIYLGYKLAIYAYDYLKKNK